LHRDDDGLASDVLGVLAAAGPLSVSDLTVQADCGAGPSAVKHARRIRRLVTEEAARSVEPVGAAERRRYQFAHDELLASAQANEDLQEADFRQRIHRWADSWRDAGWPAGPDAERVTPRYLLDSYPATLQNEPPRHAKLVVDVGWVDAAIQMVGVDRVLADLSSAATAAPGTVMCRRCSRPYAYRRTICDRRSRSPNRAPNRGTCCASCAWAQRSCAKTGSLKRRATACVRPGAPAGAAVDDAPDQSRPPGRGGRP
jgi:hypothetical protein